MREIRILLNDEDFGRLCQTGFVENRSPNHIDRIKITEEDFDKLISGEIVSPVFMKNNLPQNVKVALQDIGYDRISKHLNKSTIY